MISALFFECNPSQHILNIKLITFGDLNPKTQDNTDLVCNPQTGVFHICISGQICPSPLIDRRLASLISRTQNPVNGRQREHLTIKKPKAYGMRLENM